MKGGISGRPCHLCCHHCPALLPEGAARETWEEAGARVEVQAPYVFFDIPGISQASLLLPKPNDRLPRQQFSIAVQCAAAAKQPGHQRLPAERCNCQLPACVCRSRRPTSCSAHGWRRPTPLPRNRQSRWRPSSLRRRTYPGTRCGGWALGALLEGPGGQGFVGMCVLKRVLLLVLWACSLFHFCPSHLGNQGPNSYSNAAEHAPHSLHRSWPSPQSPSPCGTTWPT